MTARREREPRSPRAAASPRRLDSRLASIAATEVPAPPLSTARAVMESYGDGPRADDSADWPNRATREASNARPDATTTADATVAHAVDRSETTTSAERPPAPEAVDVGTRADVPPLPKPVAASAEGDSTDVPPGDDVERKPTTFEANPFEANPLDANPFAPRAFGECRICLGTSAEGGGEMCAPCGCVGSVRAVHVACLKRWCRETGAVSCELCTEKFPARFAAAGAAQRASYAARQRRAEEEQAMARERTTRLLQNFAAAYGRPANSPSDFAIINLNAVLEAEALARRRARAAGDADAASSLETTEDDGTRVVVIDALGRAVTLDTARVGAGRLARMMLEGEEAMDLMDDAFDEVRETPGSSRVRPLARGGSRRARMHGDVARVLVGQQFRFWLKAALATLCFFLALYCVLFAVAASAPATGAPVLALRVAGFALPLLLIARVAYLYRRQRTHALAAQLDEVFVIRDFRATRDFEATVDAAVGNEIENENENENAPPGHAEREGSAARSERREERARI